MKTFHKFSIADDTKFRLINLASIVAVQKKSKGARISLSNGGVLDVSDSFDSICGLLGVEVDEAPAVVTPPPAPPFATDAAPFNEPAPADEPKQDKHFGKSRR